MIKMYMILTLIVMSLMGCSAPNAPHRMTEAEFEAQHNALAQPVLPEVINLKVGEVKEFDLPADTNWWSSNQSTLSVGTNNNKLVLVGVKPGKAQACGRNDYFQEKHQFATVIVSL